MAIVVPANSAYGRMPPPSRGRSYRILPRCSEELRLEKFLDEASNAHAHPHSQGIKPIIEKKMPSFRGSPISDFVLSIVMA